MGAAQQYTIPIIERGPKTWLQTLNAILYCVVFNFGCLMINGFQFTVLLPIWLLPFASTRRLYDEGLRYSKGAFGLLLVLMSQWFAPTKLIVSFEREGQGRFTEKEIEEIVVKDASGKVIELRLPQKAVIISNHQVYADWLYAWCLTYFMGTHRGIYIVLKKSLKWVPIIGWGMQFYNFIFLARSWASDRVHLSQSLAWLGRRAEQDDTPLTFLLYPEGTLVSKDTRPVSKRYADKLGIPDMMHTLLPRSTGLHYSLRSLAPKIPSLQLIDITMAYPGIPAYKYGQSYYTLRSIFFDRVPPPAVHMHLRKFDVAKEVPIGDISKSAAHALPNGSSEEHTVEIEVPEDERSKFDLWLRDLWREKDIKMTKFVETNSLANEGQERLEIPLKLKHYREVLDAFCFFVPALVGWTCSRLRSA